MDILNKDFLEALEKAKKDYDEAGKIMIESHYTLSRDIMLASASLFGILVSLTDSSKDTYWARVFFFLSLLLILLGILMIGVSMRGRLLTDRHRLAQSVVLLDKMCGNKTDSKVGDEGGAISFYSSLKYGIYILLASMVTLLVFLAIRNDIFNFPCFCSYQ